MPENPFSIYSEIFDARKKKIQEKQALTDADIETIESIFHGEHGGNHLHHLTGTNPPVLSAYVNDARRLLFVAQGAKLSLIWIVINHDYAAFFRSLGGRFYQQPPQETQAIQQTPIISIPHFTPTPNYQYQAPKPCISYHQKLITLDDDQASVFNFPTPGVIIGDPGSGKSTLCSVLISADLNNPALLDEGRFIVYFSASGNLPEKMQQAWMLDHPITARQPAANQLLFLDYPALLAQFGPKTIEGKTPIGEAEFSATFTRQLTNKKLIADYPFIKTMPLNELLSILYHEFQFIAACDNESDYLNGKIKTHVQASWRTWANQAFKNYMRNLDKEGKHYDPNLLVWQPEQAPFSSTYHDEALTPSPAINLMLRRLTHDANILFFADPNQQNVKQISDIHYIINELGIHGRPLAKKQLKVTYRLPATMASVANAVLAIKQNINGGKNEDNQSDHVTHQVNEHDDPGSLEWVQLEKAKTFIDALNARNEVYVVITHPEYIRDAKALFGDRVVVLTINDARGQEFDSAVFFQVTNPKLPNTGKQHQSSKRKTVLQLVCESLAKLPFELDNKPNLAKPGKSDRRFEPYMNSIYIALSRAVRHGYFIEAGDPNKNELHRRLNHHITLAMKQVHRQTSSAMPNLDGILEKARLDLVQGNIAQAKAGFLKAGFSEKTFEEEKSALSKKNAALVEDILHARNPLTLAKKEGGAPQATHTLVARKMAVHGSEPTQPNELTPANMIHRVLNDLKTLEVAKKLMAIDANKKMVLIERLSNPAWKTALLHILNDKTNQTYIQAESLFYSALMLVNIHDLVAITDTEGKSHHLPFMHYLILLHSDMLAIKFNFYSEQWLKHIENSLFAKKYFLPYLNIEINLITMIAQISGETLVTALTRHQDLIAHVDWTLVYLAMDNKIRCALSTASLLDQEDFDRLRVLLTHHKEAFLSGVSIEDLFKFITSTDETIFDFIIFRKAGIQLIELFTQKLIDHPAFNEQFSDDFLGKMIIFFDSKTNKEHTAIRITLLARLTPIMTRCIEHRKSLAGFVGIMTALNPSTDQVIQEFAWNAFSIFLTTQYNNPVIINTLIANDSESLKGLPDAIWHAPIEETSQLFLTEENYVLMQFVIRRYKKTPIETFFKEAYPHAYEKALATKETLLTTNEALATLQAKAMIEEQSAQILIDNLSNPNTYALYSTCYRGEPVLKHIFASERLRSTFLRTFAEMTEDGKSDYFLLFTSYNNINQIVSIATLFKNKKLIIKIPLISFLCQTEDGKTIIRNVLEFDPSHLVKKISANSLTMTASLVEEPTNNKTYLLHYLADQAIDIFSTICEYSTVLEKVPAEYFRRPVPLTSGETLNLVTCLLRPFKKPDPNQAYCEKYINALCHLFEAAPNAVPQSKRAFIPNIGEEGDFFNTLIITVNTHLINRFLNALGSNKTLLETLIKRHRLCSPMHASDLKQRSYKTSGLSAEEKQGWGEAIGHKDVKWLNKFVRDPSGRSLLMQTLDDNKSCPLFIHFFAVAELKAAFLTLVKNLLQENARHPIGTIFTKYTLSYLMTDEDGHETPLLFSLMQHEDGYAIITILESIQEDFYARINSYFFYSDFYSSEYHRDVSLLFLAANKREASLSKMLNQNPFILQCEAQHTLTEPYEMHDNTAWSTLGSIFIPKASTEDTEKEARASQDAAQMAGVIMYSNSYNIYENTPASAWFDSNHMIGTSRTRYSLFDLMLLNQNMSPALEKLMSTHPSVLTLEFLTTTIPPIFKGAAKSRLTYLSKYPFLLGKIFEHMAFPDAGRVALQTSAEASLEQFIRRCEGAHDKTDLIKFHEEEHDNHVFEIVCLLKHITTLNQFKRKLPDGETVFSTALKDPDFRDAFLGFIFYIIASNDQENLTLHFFNVIPMNERVLTLDGTSIPLLRLIIRIPNSEKIIDTVYKNETSHYHYKKNQLHDWLAPFYQFIPEEPNSKFSHLDLLMSHPRLVEIAKLVINFRFKDVLKQFDEPYLLAKIQGNIGTTTRLALILRQKTLHAFFKILFASLKNNPGIDAKLALLLLGKNILEEDGVVPENLLISLKSSPSGREILGLFKKRPELMAALGEDMASFIEKVTTPIELPSVIPNGVFKKPTSITYQEITDDEDALNIVQSSINRMKME